VFAVGEIRSSFPLLALDPEQPFRPLSFRPLP
jgi:hypothetical protein